VAGVAEQLREEDREHEVARRIGVHAAAGRCAQGEKEQGAEVAHGAHFGGRWPRRAGSLRGAFRQPFVAPGTYRGCSPSFTLASPCTPG
jgi:hypothetical protein